MGIGRLCRMRSRGGRLPRGRHRSVDRESVLDQEEVEADPFGDDLRGAVVVLRHVLDDAACGVFRPAEGCDERLRDAAAARIGTDQDAEVGDGMVRIEDVGCSMASVSRSI